MFNNFSPMATRRISGFDLLDQNESPPLWHNGPEVGAIDRARFIYLVPW